MQELREAAEDREPAPAARVEVAAARVLAVVAAAAAAAGAAVEGAAAGVVQATRTATDQPRAQVDPWRSSAVLRPSMRMICS